jgi:hypothetical protein
MVAHGKQLIQDLTNNMKKADALKMKYPFLARAGVGPKESIAHGKVGKKENKEQKRKENILSWPTPACAVRTLDTP